MRSFFLCIVFLGVFSANIYCQNTSFSVPKEKVKTALFAIIDHIEQSYSYLDEKEIDLNCLKTQYEAKIDALQSEEDIVLFFEFLLDEFYDSHLILNTNRQSSYRLSSPIHTIIKQGKFIIESVWQTQITNLSENIIDAEILKFNGIDFQQKINDFPTVCHNKQNEIIKNWLANKTLAGKYNEPRVLTLKLKTGKITTIDLDKLKFKKYSDLLSSKKINNIAYIRIHNSLGQNNLIEAFDQTLDSLMDTKALIIDLRNTVDGGNTYVARGIMGRFITKDKPYQKHWTIEQYDNQPPVTRSWMEYVSPRGKVYTQKVVVLVGRWTGSMGEGLAIGFEGMGRAEIVGTEMEKLAGSMYGYNLQGFNFGYRLSVEKLYHVNGIPREKYIPKHLILPTNVSEDVILKKALELIK